MIGTKNDAVKVWNTFFGEQKIAKDPFGREIKFSEHGHDSDFGWEFDHIWPQNPVVSIKGSNVFSNIQPLHIASNLEKANNLQGKVNGITFAIHNNGTHDGLKIGRMAVKKDEKWFWAFKAPNY